MKKYRLLFILSALIFLSLNLSAQHILSLDISYSSFLDAREPVYNPSLGLNFEYERDNFFYGIGYISFKPKADTFYFIDDGSPSGYGTASFENYITVPLYLGRNFPINLGDKFIIKPGLQLGLNYIKYEYDYQNSYSDVGSTYAGSTISITPRIGFSYTFNESWQIYLITKYIVQVTFDVEIHRIYSIGLGTSFYLFQ